jgi:hypothetical protein
MCQLTPKCDTQEATMTSCNASSAPSSIAVSGMLSQGTAGQLNHGQIFHIKADDLSDCAITAANYRDVLVTLQSAS